MKTTSLLFCLLVTGAFAQDNSAAFNAYAAAERLRLLQQSYEAERQAALLQRQLQLNAIMSAYPNQPTLYRYLERNPRYIPTYLGK